jgi:CBS domain-containing protein
MTVGTLMTADPVCCTPETTIKDVALLMAQHDCGEIPVVRAQDDRRILGVITDRDIVCRVVAAGENPTGAIVEDAMSSPVVTVRSDSSLQDCLNLMESRQIRRMPVVDADERCCGIVSQADIAANAPSAETAELVREVSRQS